MARSNLSVNVTRQAVDFILTEPDGRVLMLRLGWKEIKRWVRREGRDVAPLVRDALRRSEDED